MRGYARGSWQLDRDAITSGAAAAGQPWQHYDLGHGWCSYTFFEQCPHRMACARCDFYTRKLLHPEASTRDNRDAPPGQLLDGLEHAVLAARPG